MANTIEVIIKATDQASAVIGKIETNITTGTANAAKSIDKLTETSAASASGFSKMQAAVVTASQAVNLIQTGVGAFKDIIDQSIGSTMAYNKSIRDLAQNLNITTEETSRIVQTADDFTVSQEAVTSALQMAVKRGMAPNIATLARMADEYTALTSPTERAARMTDVFGRNWTALVPMLKEGGQAIRDAAAAQSNALIVTEEQSKKTRELEIALDNLNDRIEGVKLTIGNKLIPVLVDAAKAYGYLNDGVGSVDETENKLSKTIAQLLFYYGVENKAVKDAEQALRDYLAVRQQVGLMDSEKSLRSNMAFVKSLGEIQTSLKDLERGVRNQAGVYDVLDAAIDKTTAKANLLASSQTLIAGEMADLKTAMAGAIKNEEKQYSDSQTELQKRLKETADELKNLEGAQGSVDKSTVKNAMSAEQLAKAHADLAAAQARLAAETDPAKQQQLAASIAVQQEKLAGANQAVVTYVDNSKKIAELKGQYDDINKEIEANAKAHEDATRRILFGYAEQQLAVGGLTETEAKALDALAVRWGLKSKEDVTAMQAIRDAALGLAKDNNINAFVGTVDRAAGEAGTSFNAIAGAADNARKAIAKAGVPVEIPITPKTDTASQTAFNNAAKNYVTNAVPVPLTPKTDPAAQTAFQNTAQGYITHPVEVPVNAKVGTVDAKTAIGAAGIPIDVPVTPKLTPGAGEGVSNQVKGFFPGGIQIPLIPKIDPADRTKIGHDLLGDLKFTKPMIKPELDYTKVKQDFSKFFNLPDVKKVQEPLVMAIKADTSSAITSMQYFSSYGLSPAVTYYDALIARASLFSTIVGLTPALPTLPGTPTTTTPTTTTPTPTRPPGAGPAEFATGADFIVPPGYPGDSFPMRVSSGERVQVTPAGQGGGGNLPPINITQTFNGAQSSPEQYRSIMYEVITDVFDKAMRQ